jgi:plastocyanin
MNCTIQIDVDAKGNMTYTPSMLRVEPGDTVQWICSSGPFTVMFKDASPFQKGMEAFAHGGTLSNALTVANVKGHFHYAVAVFHASRVHMDAGCPVLLVN